MEGRGWLAAFGGALLLSRAAAADIAPPNAQRVEYRYSIDNLANHSELTLVAWPRSCGSDGRPLGDIDLDLNPQVQGRLHDLDYEVLRPGGNHEVGKFCGGTARLYGLDARAFPAERHVSGEDDWTLGLKKGEPYWSLPALDKLTWIERIPFFEKDPRVRRSKYQFSTVGWVKAPSPLTKVHDVLHIAKVTSTELDVVPVKVVYSFDDAPDEAVMYKGSTRPEPSRPNVMLPLSDDGRPEPAPSASAAPAASAAATDSVGPAGAPASDRAPEPAKRGFAVLIIAGALAILYFALRLKRRP